jgi:hypothetical protein
MQPKYPVAKDQFKLGPADLQIAQASQVMPQAVSNIRPIDPAEFAPNGFGGLQPNVRMMMQLDAGTRRNLDQMFSVQFQSNGSTQNFLLTAGLDKGSFAIADYDFTFKGGKDAGTSGLDNRNGTSYAWVSQSNIGSVAGQLGVDRDKALTVVAAQEWMHSAVRAHPQLRGKFTTQESEILGEAASLAVTSKYAYTALGNAVLGAQPGGEGYAGITRNVLSALDRLAPSVGRQSGRELMHEYLGWNAEKGSFSQRSLNAENLGRFVSEKLGKNPASFLPAFENAVTDTFRNGAQQLLRERLPLPDR